MFSDGKSANVHTEPLSICGYSWQMRPSDIKGVSFMILEWAVSLSRVVVLLPEYMQRTMIPSQRSPAPKAQLEVTILNSIKSALALSALRKTFMTDLGTVMHG